MTEQKMTFKPVDVDFSPTGEFTVNEIEEKPEVPEEEPEVPEEEDDDNVDGDESGTDDDSVGGEDDTTGDVEEEEDVEEDDVEDVEEEEDVVNYNDLPESIQAALDFMEETGGSLQDFIVVNRNFDSMSDDQLIREYMSQQYPELDEADIAYEIGEQFGEDEDDSDAQARKKIIARKKFVADAKRSLKAQAEKYKADLGSSTASPEAQEAIKFREDFQRQQAETEKSVKARRSSFLKETNKVLDKNFKGFEVQVGDQTVLYKPEDVKKLKEQNLNVNNLLGKFTDKEGNVTDVAGYHKALTVASDPESFAAHFYELGKAAAIEEDVKDSKNPSKLRQEKGKPKPANQPKFRLVDIDGSGNKKNKGMINFRNY